MKLHAFVAVPSGVKTDSQDSEINFNRVYAELVKPALESAGLDVFRADEEERAGDIGTDMFQELLIADLAVADLTIDNPNVWHEMGVRHALRARGVVPLCGGRPPRSTCISSASFTTASRTACLIPLSRASGWQCERRKPRPGLYF